MSRHRDIRKINISDELDDDALSDGGEEEMTLEQQAQMNDGLDQVRSVIGNEAQSGLSDNALRDALWEYYFDVEKTIQWAFEERERVQLAKERQGNGTFRDSSLEFQETGLYEPRHPGHSGDSYQVGNDQDFSNEPSRPRLPSIFLAQQQPGFDTQAYMASLSSPLINRLSTISERTERTELSMLYRTRQQSSAPKTPRSFVSSDTTDYGQELDYASSADEHFRHPLDPNASGASPSGSAIQRLSTYDPPPSNSSTVSPDDQLYPMTSSEVHSPISDIPSIPDLNSKSSVPSPRLPGRVPSFSSRSQSKLSKLASSRVSTVSNISESSRSSGTSVTGSVKTFPALRPSAQSERPTSSMVSSKELPPIPSAVFSPNVRSSTSSIVRKAIQTALELEAGDKAVSPFPSKPTSTVISELSDGAKSSTPVNPSSPHVLSESKIPSSSNRPLSKLALLAQQKAEAVTKSTPSLQTLPSESSFSRPLSKLVMLAQQKVDATRIPMLPKPTTEYLIPIANGPSVTTAITTSYQSLYSLTDPSRSNVVPKLNVVPLQSPVGTFPSDPKPSKLAMKTKRAGEKPVIGPGFPSEEEIRHPISPIFQPQSAPGRALPSAFASVLVDNDIARRAKLNSKEARSGREKQRKEVETTEGRLRRSHRSRAERGSPYESGPQSVFAFDGPSPDDIILNARKRTVPPSKALHSTPSSTKTRNS